MALAAHLAASRLPNACRRQTAHVATLPGIASPPSRDAVTQHILLHRILAILLATVELASSRHTQ